MTYKIEFTDLAKGFATKVGGLLAVEEQVRGEIADLGRCCCSECRAAHKAGTITDHNDEFEIGNLLMHVVTMKDGKNEEVEFICAPKDDDTLVVDTVTYEEMEKIMKEGPFKGKKVMMPRADSE